MNSRNKKEFLLLVFLLLLLLATGAFFRVGRWLVVEDPLSPSGAIVVLSGAMPFRAEEAARLFLEGYAPDVWLTNPDDPGASVAEFGIEYYGENFYNREVLEKMGVPDNAIVILGARIENTAGEIRAISAGMHEKSLTQVIIVTSPPHTRRVRALWNHLAAPGLRAIVRPAWEDPYDANHWWRTSRDVFAVTRELLGLANTWAGLPISYDGR